MDSGYSVKKGLSMTEIIILINVIVFVFMSISKNSLFVQYGALWIGTPENFSTPGLPIQYTITNGGYWQLLTSIFMHGSVAHIFFNMYALFLFGKPLEERWGKAKFLSFYLATGILANLASVIFFLYLNKPVSLIGASGAIYGVLLAFGGYYPDLVLLLFFIIPMKTKWAILAFAVLSVFFSNYRSLWRHSSYNSSVRDYFRIPDTIDFFQIQRC
jgi:membrane associated rhomboid family serine protease